MKTLFSQISRNLFAGLLLLLLTGHNLHAAMITQPTGLNPGDTFRLVFVTSGMRNSDTTNIGAYNAFVTDQAQASAELNALGTSWSAIGSTPTIDARTNTQTDPASSTGAPIYNLLGQLVADDNADLWDGSLDNPINVDQSGNGLNSVVWTGTAAAGTGKTGWQLGAVGDRTVAGYSYHTAASWTDMGDWTGQLVSLHLYGLSDTLTVQTVPLPAAGWLFGSALCGLGCMAKRRRLNR